MPGGDVTYGETPLPSNACYRGKNGFSARSFYFVDRWVRCLSPARVRSQLVRGKTMRRILSASVAGPRAP